MHENDDVVKAYTGFSVSKYARLYGIALEDVIRDVFEEYTQPYLKSHHETLLNVAWDSLDNPKPLAYNSHND